MDATQVAQFHWTNRSGTRWPHCRSSGSLFSSWFPHVDGIGCMFLFLFSHHIQKQIQPKKGKQTARIVFNSCSWGIFFLIVIFKKKAENTPLRSKPGNHLEVSPWKDSRIQWRFLKRFGSTKYHALWVVQLSYAGLGTDCIWFNFQLKVSFRRFCQPKKNRPQRLC